MEVHMDNGFCHEPLDGLMDEFIDGAGGIDFDAWRQSEEGVARLSSYLHDVARWSPLSAPERFRASGAALAYWARAYNAFLVRAVLDHADRADLRCAYGPIVPLHGRGVLRKLAFVAGGERYDVYRLDRERLRRDVDDTRALLIRGGSTDGPPTLFPDLPEPGPELEAFLVAAAAGFVGDRTNVRIDHGTRRIVVAPIFAERRDALIADLERRGRDTSHGIHSYLSYAASPRLRQELERALGYEIVTRDGATVARRAAPAPDAVVPSESLAGTGDAGSRDPRPAPPSDLSLDLLEGDAARRFVASSESIAAWTRLYARCPWATTSQAPSFVRAWIEAYRGAQELLLVTAASPGGELVGLLPLGVEGASGAVTIAGAHQAEYQTWLADPGVGDQFGAAALDLVRRRFPDARLTLRYVPPGTPTGWLAASPDWSQRCVARPVPRALVDLREAVAEGSLKKSGNRSRLNRLRREGELRFERITDAAEFSRALDEIVPMYDLRQGAENGVLPFAADPRKRPFHEALFAAGLLHVTVLRVGDRIAAAHVGVIQGDCVCLGVFAHSPFFARHSPGKLILHMLFERLLEEGFAVFDMTPGDGWKERFGTRTDHVTKLTIHASRWDARVGLARGAADRYAKAIVVRLGATPDQVRDRFARVRRLGAVGLARSLGRRLARVRTWLAEDIEYCIYTMTAEQAAASRPQTPFAVNRIADLLRFRPMEDWQTRQGFLGECIERIAAGDRVYTHVADGVLVSYGWLSPRQERSFNTEVGQELALPPGSAVAYDYHTHPLGRGKGLHKSALATALLDAASMPGTTKVWTGVLADNGPSRHNCIKMGWTHEFSQWKRTRFGRRKRDA